MRVLILHDVVPPDARPDESDALSQARHVADVLAALGHHPSTLPIDLNLAAAADAIRSARPNLIFNLVESINRRGRLIHLAPALLDTLDIPYTGAGADATFCSSGKLIAKRLLRAAGLPTPDWRTSAELRDHPPTTGRWIIKSAWEHASIGLDDSAIVDAATADLEALLRARLPALGGEAFIEQFIDGREFNLALLASDDGPEVLPPAEITFEDFAPDQPRIVGYRAKWDDRSFEYHHTPRRFNFPPSDRPLLAQLTSLAAECWRLFNLRGHARVDFRVTPDGAPSILEVNSNPCISPDAGFAAALARSGIPMTTAVERIIADALRDRPQARIPTIVCAMPTPPTS